MIDRNVSIVDELMRAITQTSEWASIQESDPQICRANAELSTVLMELKSTIPSTQYFKVESAVYGYSTASDYAAILYGIRVADAIRDVSARSQDLSRQVMIRTERAMI